MPCPGSDLFGYANKDNCLGRKSDRSEGPPAQPLWQIWKDTEYLRIEVRLPVTGGVLLNLILLNTGDPVHTTPLYSRFTVLSLPPQPCWNVSAGVSHRQTCFHVFVFFLPHTHSFHRVNSQTIGISYCSTFQKLGTTSLVLWAPTLNTSTKWWCECTNSEHSTSAISLYVTLELLPGSFGFLLWSSCFQRQCANECNTQLESDGVTMCLQIHQSSLLPF